MLQKNGFSMFVFGFVRVRKQSLIAFRRKQASVYREDNITKIEGKSKVEGKRKTELF